MIQEIPYCPWCDAKPVREILKSTTTTWSCGSSIGCAHQIQSKECTRRETRKLAHQFKHNQFSEE